jgi:F0F1-type ATP synthase assembly protein I
VRFYGAAVLVPNMIGAVATHIANQEPLAGIVPAILGVLVGIVAWTTRPAWVQSRLGFAPVA